MYFFLDFLLKKHVEVEVLAAATKVEVHGLGHLVLGTSFSRRCVFMKAFKLVHSDHGLEHGIGRSQGAFVELLTRFILAISHNKFNFPSHISEGLNKVTLAGNGDNVVVFVHVEEGEVAQVPKLEDLCSVGE